MHRRTSALVHEPTHIRTTKQVLCTEYPVVTLYCIIMNVHTDLPKSLRIAAVKPYVADYILKKYGHWRKRRSFR